MNYFYNYGIPTHIFFFGDSLGDNLLITILAGALNKKKDANIWIKCNHFEIFRHNPDVKLVVPFNTLFSMYLLKVFKVKLLSPEYTVYNRDTDRDLIPDKHIVLKMAESIGLTGPIFNKPVLNFSPAEEKGGQLKPLQIVIMTSSSSLVAPMRNKEWIIERYQEIVDIFCDQYNFIQLGSKDDVALAHTTDLRGKTTIRESAAILKKSLLMIGHVGFMMHLARSVDCRAVIIFGGRERPDQSGYATFHNIYSAIECSPCWLRNKCDFNRRCMAIISTETVKNAIIAELDVAAPPLNVDILYN